MAEYDALFKVLFVGDSGVGKTSLLVRYVDGTPPRDDAIATAGVDFKIKTINVDGAVVKLQIWDTAGQERFRTITSSYYRGAHVIMLTYDITDPASLDRRLISKLWATSVSRLWAIECERYACDNTPRCLIGNKCDLVDKRAVTVEEAKAVAASTDMLFFETSAKTGTTHPLSPHVMMAPTGREGLEEAFNTVARTLLKSLGSDVTQKARVSLGNPSGAAAGKKRGCNV